MTDTPKEGWGWLLNSRKWHYFLPGGRSICGKWLALGNQTLEQGNDTSSDNCAACRKKVTSLKQKATAS